MKVRIRALTGLLLRIASVWENAQADADIACVLSLHAGEALDCEIERIESLLAAHIWEHPQGEAHG
jgi:hypothetical protein